MGPTELPYYTSGSGTSFSAPEVAGVIALMLEVNPQLSPAQIRDILQRTATPLPPYYPYEVGAGMLNAQAAVLEVEPDVLLSKQAMEMYDRVSAEAREHKAESKACAHERAALYDHVRVLGCGHPQSRAAVVSGEDAVSGGAQGDSQRAEQLAGAHRAEPASPGKEQIHGR